MSRLFAAVISLCVTALLLAATGAADTSTTVPYTAVTLNECNGELVNVEGKIHTTEGSTVDANGTHFHITMNLVGVKGVAPLSGARYVESDTQTQTSNFHFDGASEANVVETRILNRLGEDGTLDDFRYHLRFHMTVNANGVITVDRTESEIDCN
jgi:hypothetical protein